LIYFKNANDYFAYDRGRVSLEFIENHVKSAGWEKPHSGALFVLVREVSSFC